MSRSVPDGPPEASPAGDGSTALAWPSHDWRLLVGLPGQVLTTALAGRCEDPGDRVNAAVTGLEAIAAGRLFDSDLVRMVANAIYAESGSRTEAAGPPAPPAGPASTSDPPAEAGGTRPRPVEVSAERRELAEVLSACRTAADLLGRRADPADSAAYRQWVQSVAARTAGAPSGYVTEIGRALGLTPDT